MANIAGWGYKEKLTRKMHTFSTIKTIPTNLGHFITPNLGMSKSGFPALFPTILRTFIQFASLLYE